MIASPRRAGADVDLSHLSPLQRALALVFGVLFVAPVYFAFRPLYLAFVAIAKALAPSARQMPPEKEPPKEEKPCIEAKENPEFVPKTSIRGPSRSFPAAGHVLELPKATVSAPGILPCGEAAIRDAEKSMWYAQLANSLAWVPSPVRLLSDYLPRKSGSEQETEAGSGEATPASTPSTDRDESGGSIDSSSTKVETTSVASKASTSSINVLEHAGTIRRRPAGPVAMALTPSARTSKSIDPTRRLASRIPTYMRQADGRPLNALPGIIFTQRYVNPLSAAFGVSLRREHGRRPSVATPLAGNISDTTLTGENCCGGRMAASSLGSPWLDPFTMDTPRAGAQLSRGKFGSIRKLGTRLRNGVSIRHSRSASLDIGPRTNASLQPSPLRQQVLTGERAAASRMSSRSLSASMSLPYALGLDINQPSLGWEYGLP